MKKLIIATALSMSAAALAQPPAHIGTSDQTHSGQTVQQGQETEMDDSGATQSNPAMGTGGQGSSTGSQSSTGTMSGTMGGAQGNNGAWSGAGGPGNGAQGMRNYPACSRTVTDSCVQTNERGMRRGRR